MKTKEFAPDLTPSEREILWSVYSVVRASGVSPGTDQLARGSGKTAAQVSVLIGGLMGKGYLQRQHKPKFEARLTDKALDAFGALKDIQAPKPDKGRNGRNLDLERQWERTSRQPRRALFLRPTSEQLDWLAAKSEAGETPGKTASRILFSEIVRKAIDG